MSWRWWPRPAQVDGPNPAIAGFRSQVWADLIRPDSEPAQVAELTARQAAELAALKRVLNEPTMILERGVRVPPFVVRRRRFGWWGVRHA